MFFKEPNFFIFYQNFKTYLKVNKVKLFLQRLKKLLNYESISQNNLVLFLFKINFHYFKDKLF